MFAGFNLKLDADFFVNKEKSFEEYKEIGKKHLEQHTCNVDKELEKYITNNVIDGARMQEEWFPQVKADIFLSHSSHDKELVNAIAGWIYNTFGLTCFIDSNVWDYAGRLAETLNEKYSNKREDGKGGYLYNHKSCLKVSEHINSMLNIALYKMIDKCECIILINTENSINISNDGKSLDKTYSPWIYSELVCSKIVRTKSLDHYRQHNLLKNSIYESSSYIPILHTTPTDHLIKICGDDLEKWNERYREKKEYLLPLDYLYIEHLKNEENEY